MRLNGIYAVPGTYLGQTSPRPLSIGLMANGGIGGCGHYTFAHTCYPRINLRPLQTGELDSLRNQEPRSVAEHENLRRIRTVYGMARTFNPNTKGLGPVQDGSYLDRLRMEKKIKVARRRNQAELRHLYRLREGK